jgi:O-antigen biosynthesis protein
MLKDILGLFTKLGKHIRLLREDPERFGRNLLQFTDPAQFQARLVDILSQPPLEIRINSGQAAGLNILQPILSPEAMTGGPNTIVLLAALVADAGLAVRIVTTRAAHRTDPAWFAAHVSSLLGRPAPASLQVCVGASAQEPVEVGDNDLWLATHWTTAQNLRPVLSRMRRRWFLYLIQDYEPGFYAWSSNHALALETYELPHRAIINEAFLAHYLLQQRTGLYADPSFLKQRCIVFEPAVDRRVFYPPTPSSNPDAKAHAHRLLFYARPTNHRNLFGLGLQALRAAVMQGVFAGDWVFVSIGGRGSLGVMSLNDGRVLRPARWESYTGYAESLRQADVLLCPMLSPHTSYPVLEMAACGGVVVTTTFGDKTAESLRSLSPQILGVPATLQGLVDGLRAAVTHAQAVRSAGAGEDRLALDSRWDSVLLPVAEWTAAAVREVAEIP